jgi:hypothetical protein
MGERFFRWQVKRARMYVSVCLKCCQFVGAEPDEISVEQAENAHLCPRDKRPSSVKKNAGPEPSVKAEDVRRPSDIR